MYTYFNMHTHHPTGGASVLEVENLYPDQMASGKTPCCSAGLHPWFLKEGELESARRWLDEQSGLPTTCAIGEAGLDKVCDTPWDLQEEAFRYCIKVSEMVQKPLVLHCVRAYNETIALKKELHAQQPWIFHGYNKSPEMARLLLDAGCFLSFGKALFNTHNHSSEVLKMMPEDRFFLETDDTGDLDIATVYERAAEIRHVSVSEIREILERNVRNCLRI